MRGERWKHIPGCPYMISNKGRVLSIHKAIFLKPNKLKKGYLAVKLYMNDGSKKGKLVSRLVAEAFKKNSKNLPEVHHKDYNKENNNVGNLKWCTTQYNIKHSYFVRNRTNECEKNPFTIFNNKQVRQIRKRFYAGETYRKIADSLNARYDTIWKLINRINYRTL